MHYTSYFSRAVSPPFKKKKKKKKKKEEIEKSKVFYWMGLVLSYNNSGKNFSADYFKFLLGIVDWNQE